MNSEGMGFYSRVGLYSSRYVTLKSKISEVFISLCFYLMSNVYLSLPLCALEHPDIIDFHPPKVLQNQGSGALNPLKVY